MKILFDTQIFDAQKYGGISRYFSELFKYFNTRSNITYDIPIKNTRNEYIKVIPPFSETDLSRKILFPIINFKLQRIFSKIYDIVDYNSNRNKTKRALRKQDYDVFHPTYYSDYFLRYLKNKPMVLTVYDMIHEIYPEYFALDKKTVKLKKKLILRADKIIAISKSTKIDIMHFYNIPEDKIKVIYLGNSLYPMENQSILNKIQIPEKYILFVGSRDIYKNFDFFIKSISPILNKDKSINVIVAGGYSGKNAFSEKETSLFKELNIDQQIFQYSIDDETLSILYEKAVCFVFPSLYEGFGIPVLEAFACNCPAVISNTSSLPEIGGDAARYFDPKDNTSIIKAVDEVVYNERIRSEMILKGQQQLKKFSWTKTGEETLALYYDIIEII